MYLEQKKQERETESRNFNIGEYHAEEETGKTDSGGW